MSAGFAPAAERNRVPIEAALGEILHRPGRVLEIGSGTGQHAIAYSRTFANVVWQTSNPPASGYELAPVLVNLGRENLPPPLTLDLLHGAWPDDCFTDMVAINVLHIAPWAATIALFNHAPAHLVSGGKLILYGPWRYRNRPLAPSNEAFDAQLRASNPQSGIRTLDDAVALGNDTGLELSEDRAMPANNRLLVFSKF